MSELPNGWALTTIGNVCRSKPQYGWTSKSKLAAHGLRYLRITDMTTGSIDWSGVPFCTDEPKELDKFLLSDGDIVVARSGATFGRSVRLQHPEPAVFASYLVRLQGQSDVVKSAYLGWFLRSPQYWREAKAASSGIAQPNLNARSLAGLPIPLPPIPEQQRIVAAIEEQLSRLDAAESALQAVARKLDHLRHSTLVGALGAGWPTVPLDDCLVSLRNGMFVSRPAQAPPGVPIFRISAVRAMRLDVDDVRYADVAPDSVEQYFVQEGDLLFTRYSGNPDFVGACAVVPVGVLPVLHPDKLIRGVVDRARFNPTFIALAVSVGAGRRAIEQRLKTTAGQVGIAGGQLKTVPILAPPLAEQDRIVVEIERRSSLIDAMVASVDAAIRRAAGLRQAVLWKAIKGTLVPQDPTDEPADVLLDRVLAERNASANRPSGRGRTKARAT